MADGKYGYKVKQIISQHTQQPTEIFTSHNNIHKNDRKHTKPVRDFRLLHGVNEIFAPLGWYKVWISFSYRRFQTTYQTRLQGSSSPRRILV